MKRLIRLPFKMIWRLALPVRRPVVRRLEELVRRNAVQPAPQVHLACRVPDETNVVMDHMIRELVRLQIQVEQLRQTIEDLTPESLETNLTVVGTLDREDEPARSAAG